MYIEKAYAKMYRNYRVLAWGHCGIASRELTGAPSGTISLEDKNKGWTDIRKALSDGWLVTNLSRAENSNKNKAHVTGRHCYAVLDAVEYKVNSVNKNSSHNRIEKYVLLKNPWDGQDNGHLNFSNDVDPLTLSSEKKKELWKLTKIQEDPKNNLFWLNWNSYLECFKNFVYVNKVKPNYCHSSLELYNQEDKPKKILVRALAPKGTTGTITFNRKQLRHLKLALKQPSHYGKCEMTIFESKNGYSEKNGFSSAADIKVKKNKKSSESVNNAEITFGKNEIFILLEIDFPSKENLNIVLSAYTSKPVYFEEVEYDGEAKLKPVFMAKGGGF